MLETGTVCDISRKKYFTIKCYDKLIHENLLHLKLTYEKNILLKNYFMKKLNHENVKPFGFQLYFG